MTAEVVIMNRLGVALAADSAVTIGGQKILNSANKLYMLAPNHSVGVLVFNNSDFMGVPWEILIQQFRNHLTETGTRFDLLEEYLDDFVRFLREEAHDLFPVEIQDNYVNWLIERTLVHDIRDMILEGLQQKVLAQGGTLSEDEILEFSAKVVDQVCRIWEDSADLPVPDGYGAVLEEAFRPHFDNAYDEHLGNVTLPPGSKDRLWSMTASCLTKARWFNQHFTGVAFAGYGDRDLYPRLGVYQFESYVRGHLKHTMSQPLLKVGPKPDESSAAIVPLAQDDVVRTIIEGVHPTFLELLQEHVDGFAEASGTVRTKMREQFTNPIVNIVATLPKDELANMAETLVSMTSFMRRVSSNLETVGGPIDVAVISKKDGLVWINRKHYFKPNQNYHFFARGQNAQPTPLSEELD